MKPLAKLRVYEYAKQLNMSSKEILTILNRLDVPVANHMSVMDGDMVNKVEQFFEDVKKRAAQKHATEVEKELREKQRSREKAARQSPPRDPGTTGSAPRAGSSGETRRPPTQRDSQPQRMAPSGSEQQRTSTSGANGEGRPSSLRSTGEGSGVSQREASTSAQGQTSAETTSTGPNQRSDAPGSANANTQRPAPRAGEQRRSDSGSNRDNRAPRQAGGGRPNGSYQGGQSSTGGSGGGRPGGSYQGGQSSAGGTGGDRRSNTSRRPGTDSRSAGNDRAGGGRSGGGGSYGDRGGRPGGGTGGGGTGSNAGRGGGGYGGRQGGTGSTGGSRPGAPGAPGRSGSGGRPGGNRGGMGAVPASQSKPASPGSKAKDKERERGNRNGYPNRREQFNEDKLRSGGRRRGRGNHRGTEPRRQELPKEITVEGSMAVGDFAKLLAREPSEVIKKLMSLGIMATINQEIETDAMELIAGEFGVEMKIVEPVDEEAVDMLVEEDKEEDLRPRPPVVTIMGHVDHGKTTLLDAIRKSRVTATESGGITQHIGAYQVDVSGRTISFLDTPGHEAFTTMRARGAQVTDITILVVAADDGVMPQTVEAINHAKAANVPIIVAVNKMDKPAANPDRVMQELAQYELVPEAWGGDTVFAYISALQGEGLEELLEMVLLVADLKELKANPVGRPRGTVIEAELDKGRGPVATVLVQNGTLRVGDLVVVGKTYGRIRAMVDDLGQRIKEAGPSQPVEIQGLNDVPSAGELFVMYDEERSARGLVQKRTNREKVEQMQNTSRVTLDDLYRQIKEGNMKELNVIVKADVQGSVEALVQSIEKIDVEGVRVRVIHKGAGAINESDVSLASASNAIIIGFHVRPDVNAKRAAETESVDIRQYRVIYNVTEELESAMKGLLDPEFKEVVIGHAEVRDVFHISRVGTVAGCYVVDGKLARDAECRLVRDGIVVYEGELDSLKRFKDDAKEVAQGFECGVTLTKYNDIKVGDVVEAFKMEAVKPH